jgi:hypothetical protein
MGLLARLRDRLLPWLRPLTSSDASPEHEIDTCIWEHVEPALQAVRDQLAAEGYETRLERGNDRDITLRVTNYNGLPLTYAVRGHIYKEAVVNIASMADSSELARYTRVAIESGGKIREYPTRRCHRDAIEEGAMAHYRKFLMTTPTDD